MVSAAATAALMAQKMDRQFFGGSIRLHILHHAAQEQVFGQGLIEELGRHGYRLSPGTLYPILHRLEREGYLRSKPKLVGGKKRRMYSATAAGASALIASKAKVVALLEELLEGEATYLRVARQPKKPITKTVQPAAGNRRR